MALVIKDRISETTTTTGTGAVTLAGAIPSFQAFSVIGNGNTTYYCITDGSSWEVGLGTYSSSGNTLARTTVYATSSGTTSPITLTAGIKNVFSCLPADGIVTVDGSTIQVPQSAVLPVANGGTGSSTATFSGANITSLNASNISSGTIANARTTASSSNGASTIVARDATGNFSANVITANGSSITSLNASNISTGTLDNARTSASSSNGASTIVARDASGNFAGATITATTFSGSGGSLTSLNASNVSTGVLAVANGGTGSSTATFSGANITSLNASNISSGTIDNARTTASSINGANTIVLRDASGDFAADAITANSFSGDGSSITGINASNISTGTIANARTTATHVNGASTIVARDASGNFAGATITATTFSGSGGSLTSLNASNVSTGVLAVANGGTGSSTATFSGANITSLNASNISSGTIANARTTATDANGASTIVARDASGNFTGATITATTFSGSGASLTSLNASNISSGTVATARLASGTANSTTYLRGDQTWATVAGGITVTTQTYDTGTSVTWTKPTGVSFVQFEIWSGGGSGAKGAVCGCTGTPINGGGGGGGGAYFSQTVKLSDLVGSVVYTVGAGGAARSSNNTAGASGGNTSITLNSFAGGSNITITVYGGGGGGVTSGCIANGGFGGNGLDSVTSFSPIPYQGSPGNSSLRNSVFGGAGGGSQSTAGGFSVNAGGGGGGGSTSSAGAGGVSYFGGGNGGAGGVAGAGTAGTTPGGGGGGARGGGGNSGAGGSGRVRFTYW